MNFVFIDFETYYEEKSTVEGQPPYSAKNLSTAEYVLDPRFKALGFGLAVNDKPAIWVDNDAPLKDPKTRALLQNAMIIAHRAHFDAPILDWIYDLRPEGNMLWGCTLSMARAMGHREDVGGSLERLAKYYGLGQKPPLTPDATPEELRIRGTWDVDACRKLFRIFLANGFPKEELFNVDMTIRQFTESVVEGDVAKLQKVADEAKARRESALARLGVTQKDVGSNLKLIALFENLGVEVPYKQSPTDKDKLIPAFAKTDDGMQELLNHDDETVRALAETRIMIRGSTDETRANTYIRLAQSGPLPIFYNYWGTHPGRWSGGDGTNFANLKRGGVLRDCLLAPAGHVFVEADMKQIQARLAAWLAGQADLLEAFAQGRDVYCEFGGDLFVRPITKKDEFERFCSKFWVLGGWFGMGAAAGHKQLKAKINAEKKPFAPPTIEECEGHVATLRSRYDKMEALWDTMERFIARPGNELGPLRMGQNKVLLPNGTAIHYPQLRQEYFKDFYGKQRFGWRYTGQEGRVSLWGGKQTQNACLALERVLLVYFMAKLRPFWNIVMHTYDSICICCKENQVDAAKAAMGYVMTHGPAWAAGLPLAVDIGTGRTYGECGNK